MRIANLDVHQDIVPAEIAGFGVVPFGIFELGLTRPVFERRVINDEGQVLVVERRLFDILRICQLPKRARLIRISLVHAESLHAAFTRFLVKPHCVIVIQLEAVA